nr:hypothetical protein [Tanacetum cinerariifolium]
KTPSEIFEDVYQFVKADYDLLRHKASISEYMRGIGAALQLRSEDASVRKVFEELAVAYVLDADTDPTNTPLWEFEGSPCASRRRSWEL